MAKDLWSGNQLDESAWMRFASCDVNYFHVVLRSILDYLSKIIRQVSDSPREVPDRGFYHLKNTWLAKPHSSRKLGTDLAQLVLSCDWFERLKAIRESIVHAGGRTILFPVRDRILFQVHEGIERKVLMPEITFNENVVDFELYAGLHIGYLMAYLEEISELVFKR